jgi:guanylate kinase
MQNKLTHLSEFRAVLDDYHVSEVAAKVLHQCELILMVGPTLSGRNTIINELLKTGKYHNVVSDTTRQPRSKGGVQIEENGREYWFRGEQEILSDLRAGKFLEAALIHNQQVSGISIRELEAARHEGKIAVTDVEIVGVRTILQAKPDTLILFVMPPSFAEWERRLEARGDMHPEEAQRRLESMVSEIQTALDEPRYQFVVNDDLAQAVEAVRYIAETGQQAAAVQEAGRAVARQLLRAAQTTLAH